MKFVERTDETMTLADIREAFPGYHVEIQMFPTGGVISLEGCEDCGTDGSEFYAAGWKPRRGRSLAVAIERLKAEAAEYHSTGVTE
jgi:hypothetical protein